MPEQMQPQPQGQGLDQSGYDIFVAQGFKILAGMGAKLKGKASVEQLGNTLFEIVKKIEAEGAKNGVDFGIEVVLHGSNEILSKMIEVAQVDIQEEQIKAVIGVAVGRYIDNAIKTGKMTPEEVQGLAQQAQQSAPGQGPQPGQEPAQPPPQAQKPGILQGA